MSTVATAVVFLSSSVLLGCAFSHWRVDYGVLWHEVLPGSIEASRAHYTDLISLPPWVNATVLSIGALAIAALLYKISSGDPSAFLFDGGSLVLFGAIGIVYGTNVQKAPAALQALSSSTPEHKQFELLKDLASSNTIIAVALTGVLALQLAQSYAERSTPVAKATAPKEPPVAIEAPTSAGEGEKSLKPKRSSARLRQQAAAFAS